MMKYLLKHIRECITIVAQIVIGILLLVNPSIYAVSLIRILGALLILRGGIRIIHYLQKEAAEAAEGEEFATGLMAVTLGLFCIFGQNWWSEAHSLRWRWFTVCSNCCLAIRRFRKRRTVCGFIRSCGTSRVSVRFFI